MIQSKAFRDLCLFEKVAMLQVLGSAEEFFRFAGRSAVEVKPLNKDAEGGRFFGKTKL